MKSGLGLRIGVSAAALLATIFAPPVQAGVQTKPVDRKAWTEKLAGLGDDWRAAAGAANRLAGLPPDEGLPIVREAWSKLSVRARQQFLKAFGNSQHPRKLDVLHLGATDPAEEVRSWAWSPIAAIAFRNFKSDAAAYAEWYAANRARPIAEIQLKYFPNLLAEIRTAKKVERERLTDVLGDARFQLELPALRTMALEQDLPETLIQWVSDPEASSHLCNCAGWALDALEPDDAFLRRRALPLISSHAPPQARALAAHLLGSAEAAWAVEPLIERLKQAARAPVPAGTGNAFLSDVARALGEIGDSAAIPAMIEVIEADNSHATVYDVGYGGLRKITGVEYDESHDGAWWRKWWSENRERVLQEARHGKPVPDAEDVADIPVEDLRAAGNERMRYLLIGPKPGATEPEKGYRLLVVLPGGSGSIDFHPFVKRILKRGLPDGYLIAQPIAVKWTRRQARKLVWPTKLSTMPAVKFSTEQFVDAVVQDVRQRRKIDPRFMFTLGWSSGGPPCYAISLRKKTPITGAFVAMSVFHPTQPQQASGRSFYLLHSPDDFIPIRHPESARDLLKRHGARVELTTYAGGHGWHGDVYGMIRRGIEWLEAQQSADSDAKPSP